MIDQTRLQELEDDFGADELGEIVEAFLDEAFEAVDELQTLDRDADLDAIGRHLHFLKGCARNVGAMDLGDICEALEAQPANAVSGEVTVKLRSDLEAVRQWFRVKLAS